MAKVGGMLDEQLRGKGNPQFSHDARIGLDDLGINMTQSSRWQQIFRVGADKRYGGGILYEMEKNPGGWLAKQESCGNTMLPQDLPPKLSDMGMSKMEFYAISGAYLVIGCYSMPEEGVIMADMRHDNTMKKRLANGAGLQRRLVRITCVIGHVSFIPHWGVI